MRSEGFRPSLPLPLSPEPQRLLQFEYRGPRWMLRRGALRPPTSRALKLVAPSWMLCTRPSVAQPVRAAPRPASHSTTACASSPSSTRHAHGPRGAVRFPAHVAREIIEGACSPQLVSSRVVQVRARNRAGLACVSGAPLHAARGARRLAAQLRRLGCVDNVVAARCARPLLRSPRAVAAHARSAAGNRLRSDAARGPWRVVRCAVAGRRRGALRARREAADA
jgi:hypothetical protein